MRWTEATWFKNLCMVVVCIFFSQSVQPMAFGFASPQGMTTSTVKQLASPGLLKNHLEDQVSSMLDKVKGQLKELEVLPNIEELTKKQVTDDVSCTAPAVNPLAASEMSELASTKSFNPHPNLLPAREKEQMKGEKKKKDEESGGENWLDWLSSLLVSEAHAQTPDPNLASTPDANTTDQFIIDKAQALGNDANAIFAFVRDEILRGRLR